MPSPNGLLSLTVTATEQGGSGSKSIIVALMTPMLPATSLALHPSQGFGVTQQFRTSAMSTYPGGDIPLISMSAKDPFNNNSCQVYMYPALNWAYVCANCAYGSLLEGLP